MVDLNFDNLSETSKAIFNGVPFLAGVVQDVPTPYYTKLLQAVITAIVIGLIAWAASLVMSNKHNSDAVLNQLVLINNKLEYMNLTISENKAEINALKNATKDRVYRPEWQQKYREQDERLLHLERAVK